MKLEKNTFLTGLCIPTDLSHIRGCIYTFAGLMLCPCRRLPVITSVCCCLLRAVRLCPDNANCPENESPLPFSFRFFGSVFSFFFFFFLFWFWSKPHRKRNCSFLHSTRVLMRSLNFDDHPFMQYTFGQSKGLGPRGKQIFSPEL